MADGREAAPSSRVPSSSAPSSSAPSSTEPNGTPLRRIEALPGPKGLPVLGNLLDIDRSRLHVTLEGWARTYGDLYTFRVGRKRAVVVSEPTSVERALRGRPGLFRRVATAAP